MAHQSDASADFVILNEGVLRSTWSGQINYENVYGMIPFDESLVNFKIWGK